MKIIFALLLLIGGCLATGCVTHGSRTVKVEFFGQKIEISDHTENDTTGQPNWSATFDDWFKKFLDSFKKPAPPATEPTP